MSRSGYGGSSGPFDLYRQAVAQASRGVRGQRFFKEALQALDALPQPRLIRGELTDGGDFCLLGAVAEARGLEVPEDAEPYQLCHLFDIAPRLAAEIMFMNDEAGEAETPEQRFSRVLLASTAWPGAAQALAAVYAQAAIVDEPKARACCLRLLSDPPSRRATLGELYRLFQPLYPDIYPPLDMGAASIVWVELGALIQGPSRDPEWFILRPKGD